MEDYPSPRAGRVVPFPVPHAGRRSPGDPDAGAPDLDPEDWSAARSDAHAMLDAVMDHLQSLRSRPVWTPVPGQIRQELRQPLDTDPTDLSRVCHDFVTKILPYGPGNLHPGFMGWVQGGGNVAGLVGELASAGLNANVGGRDQAALEVERQVLQWVRRWFSFPDNASGLFVTGASMANFLGVQIARSAALGPGVRRHGLQNTGRRLVAYASSAVHNCVTRAMEMSGLGSSALHAIRTDGDGRIDTAHLAVMLAEDRAFGLEPFLLIGTAGTVDVGAIDNLQELAAIAAREHVWFHVDGAIGGLGILAPGVAPRLAGIELADSIALDFHKWGQVPYDAGYLLVRSQETHLQTFASDAAYLRREPRGLSAGSPWPCDFGPDLSRGFRALKTWFTLRTHGTERIGAVIDHTCRLAQYLKTRIESSPELELLAPVNLNIVCFRFRADESDRVNAGIVADLQESGVAAPSTTTINGRLAIRAAIVNHRTRVEDVDRLVSATLALGAAAVQGDGCSHGIAL